MDSDVVAVVASQSEGLIANGADVLLDRGVGQEVLCQTAIMSELLAAGGAPVGFHSCVNSEVFHHVALSTNVYL